LADNDSQIADSPGEVLGPFTDVLQRFTSNFWEVAAANVPKDLHWKSLLLMVFLGVLLFWIRGGHGAKTVQGAEHKCGLLEYLLPRDIYTHLSARVDIWLYVLERILRPLWAVGLFATIGAITEQSTIGLLQNVFGGTPAMESNIAWMLLYTLLTLLSYDFIFYSIHYTMHKLPALWALHKIHHSAEVLTPLTRYREHFLSGPIWAAGAAIGYSIPAGVFAYMFDGGITQVTVMNVGVFTLLFGFNGAFRHYHVAFHYPRWLSKWLQSPAMHHTHHSYLPQHWDTNMAAVTSIYDRIFGTLYIPEKDEFTPWGIGPEKQGEHRTFWQNTVGPFRDWYRMLTTRNNTKTQTDTFNT